MYVTVWYSHACKKISRTLCARIFVNSVHSPLRFYVSAPVKYLFLLLQMLVHGHTGSVRVEIVFQPCGCVMATVTVTMAVMKTAVAQVHMGLIYITMDWPTTVQYIFIYTYIYCTAVTAVGLRRITIMQCL